MDFCTIFINQKLSKSFNNEKYVFLLFIFVASIVTAVGIQNISFCQNLFHLSIKYE